MSNAKTERENVSFGKAVSKSKFKLPKLSKKPDSTTNGPKPTFMESLRAMFEKKPETENPAVIFKEPPANGEKIEAYSIQPSYSQVTVMSLPELGGGKAYFISEVKLGEEDQLRLRKLSDILSKEIEPPKNDNGKKIDPVAHIDNEAIRLAEKYHLVRKDKKDKNGELIGDPWAETWAKILYYLHRDFLGFGHIHVVMNDPMIEDISVNGIGIPVYVWHRKYESMPTNLTFLEETALDNLIVKLTHLSSKHISTAFPILDAMLPSKDRLAATYKREVSPKGGSFTIRRFREEPFSIIDLVEMGTINEEIGAYFWLLIENRMTIAVIGGTGAGKTSTLNALASLVKPQMKIVTVEEIPEMNVPHENWVQLVSRESYGLGTVKTGEVTLFDLVKTSLRYRPDYIVVGEIRGEEAFVLFQALATGHGGLTTLHADSLDYAIKRLTSPPMNVSKIYVPLINVASMVERVQLPSAIGNITFGRRLTNIAEVVDFEEYRQISTWNPLTDSFRVNFENSEQLRRIAIRNGLTLNDILNEIGHRVLLLRDLRAKGIRKNVDLAKFITNYYVESQTAKIQEIKNKKE
ncbi:MAG TPA: type II/IV secretion system ATPase subunit [Candidatus Bathyarchaeia archaeon]|nr:type II/IV secretion system ATPase subunit [Candidatus Bathyarchaeia archaeon]